MAVAGTGTGLGIYYGTKENEGENKVIKLQPNSSDLIVMPQIKTEPVSEPPLKPSKSL